MAKSSCGLSEEVVLEHTKLLESLVLEKDAIKNDVHEMKSLVKEVHKILCISNGKRSIVDQTEQNKDDIKAINDNMERRKADNKFTIEQIIVVTLAIGAMLVSVFAKWII